MQSSSTLDDMVDDVKQNILSLIDIEALVAISRTSHSWQIQVNRFVDSHYQNTALPFFAPPAQPALLVEAQSQERMSENRKKLAAQKLYDLATQYELTRPDTAQVHYRSLYLFLDKYRDQVWTYYFLGMLCYYGRGTFKNVESGTEYLVKALTAGDVKAAMHLTTLLTSLNEDVNFPDRFSTLKADSLLLLHRVLLDSSKAGNKYAPIYLALLRTVFEKVIDTSLEPNFESEMEGWLNRALNANIPDAVRAFINYKMRKANKNNFDECIHDLEDIKSKCPYLAVKNNINLRILLLKIVVCIVKQDIASATSEASALFSNLLNTPVNPSLPVNLFFIGLWSIITNGLKDSSKLIRSRIRGNPVNPLLYILSAVGMTQQALEIPDQFAMYDFLFFSMYDGMDWENTWAYADIEREYMVLVAKSMVFACVGWPAGIYKQTPSSNVDQLGLIKKFHRERQMSPGMFVYPILEYRWCQDVLEQDSKQALDLIAEVWEMQLAAQCGDVKALIHLFIQAEQSSNNDERAYCYCALSVIAHFGIFNATGPAIRELRLFNDKHVLVLADTLEINLDELAIKNQDFFYNDERSKQLLQRALEHNPDTINGYLDTGKQAGILSEHVEAFLRPESALAKSLHPFKI